ncbi:hypothetical protein ACWD25_11620 [Streptomyces sp. NPDC002920]
MVTLQQQYASDLVYLMAWLPLVLAGAPYLSLDAAWHNRRRQRAGDFD